MRKLFLVRHGESEGNINKSKYFEKLDCEIELTDKGKEQAAGVYDRLAELMYYDTNMEAKYALSPWSVSVYNSPYKRAQDTANIIKQNILDNHGYGSLTDFDTREDPRLRERHWEGLRENLIKLKNPEDREQFFNFYYKTGHAESFANLYDRVSAFDMWMKLYPNNNDVTIIASHGEWIKMFIFYKLGLPVSEWNSYKTPRNCEVFYFRDDSLSSDTPITLKTKV